MGSKIKDVFASQGKALIGYVTAGYPVPDEQFFVELALALHEAGVDILEVGVPFSDPMADGEVIQRAMQGALSGNFGLKRTLKAIEMLKECHEGLPVVLFGYFNPFYRMGLDVLTMRLKELRAAGILVVDLPVEEGARWYRAIKSEGIDPIQVVPNDVSLERLQEIAPFVGGFLYITSTYAPTGGTVGQISPLSLTIERARATLNLPVAVGFGIQTPEDAFQVGKVADGVIVGSALIRALEDGIAEGGPKRAIQLAQKKAEALKKSLVKGALLWRS